MATQAQPATQSAKSKVDSPRYNEEGGEPELIAHSIAKIDGTSESRSIRQRQELIAETAYYLAQKRGFESGHDLEDWITAEAMIGADSGAWRRTDADH